MRHSIVRDGIIAGFLGATAVAVVFFVIDVIFRSAFYTPLGLGRGLLTAFGPTHKYSPATIVIAYTIFHYAAFVGVAWIASVIVHAARRQPAILAGAFILLVAIEFGIYFLSAALAQSPFFGTLTWVEVAAGILIAAVVMGVYLWKTHPDLVHNLDRALGDRVDENDPATPVHTRLSS